MSNETVTVDKGVLVRAAAAISAYLSAMRVDDLQDTRETIMARIRGADAMALPAYEELYWLLNPEEAALTRGVEDAPPAGIDPAELLRLAEALEKGAEVRGTVHHQADWQRIAQRRAAGILRGFVMAHTSAVKVPAPPGHILAPPTDEEAAAEAIPPHGVPGTGGNDGR